MNAVKDLKEAPQAPVMSFDLQMNHIKRIVWNERKRCTSSKEPIAEVTNVLYEQARDFFLDLVKNKYKF